MPLLVRAKCLIVGDAGCGKSSLCQVFHSDGSYAVKNYSMTCGSDLLVKSVTIPGTKDTVELYVYDTAGKEVFHDLVRQFMVQPSMVMVVYDVTNEISFSSCQKWLQRVRSQKPDVDIPSALVANKTDLVERRVVSPKAGKDIASKLGLEYFECSAKEASQVEIPFFFLANEYYKIYQEKVDATTAIL